MSSTVAAVLAAFLEESAALSHRYLNIVRSLEGAGEHSLALTAASAAITAVGDHASGKDVSGSDDEKDGDGKKKRKRKDKVVDKDRPKRPPSGYLLYVNDQFAKCKAANPNATQGEIMKTIGSQWGQLNEAAKTKFQQQAEKLKVTYIENIKRYDAAKLSTDAAAASSSAAAAVAATVVTASATPKKADTTKVVKKPADGNKVAVPNPAGKTPIAAPFASSSSGAVTPAVPTVAAAVGTPSQKLSFAQQGGAATADKSQKGDEHGKHKKHESEKKKRKRDGETDKDVSHSEPAATVPQSPPATSALENSGETSSKKKRKSKHKKGKE